MLRFLLSLYVLHMYGAYIHVGWVSQYILNLKFHNWKLRITSLDSLIDCRNTLPWIKPRYPSFTCTCWCTCWSHTSDQYFIILITFYSLNLIGIARMLSKKFQNCDQLRSTARLSNFRQGTKTVILRYTVYTRVAPTTTPIPI